MAMCHRRTCLLPALVLLGAQGAAACSGDLSRKAEPLAIAARPDGFWIVQPAAPRGDPCRGAPDTVQLGRAIRLDASIFNAAIHEDAQPARREAAHAPRC